jgi:hypothetical protein
MGKYIRIASCLLLIATGGALAIMSSGIFDYGSVEFRWLKQLAVGGWSCVALLGVAALAWQILTDRKDDA